MAVHKNADYVRNTQCYFLWGYYSLTKKVGLRLRKVISRARATGVAGYRLHATLYLMDNRTQSILKSLDNNHTAKH